MNTPKRSAGEGDYVSISSNESNTGYNSADIDRDGEEFTGDAAPFDEDYEPEEDEPEPECECEQIGVDLVDATFCPLHRK